MMEPPQEEVLVSRKPGGGVVVVVDGTGARLRTLHFSPFQPGMHEQVLSSSRPFSEHFIDSDDVVVVIASESEIENASAETM